MIQEIISTSASRCLDGNAGFGIVAQTAGMAPNLSQTVNALSGYNHIAPPGSEKNPVVFLHVTRKNAGVVCHIISRIADCGYDYSGRSNRIAHHWVLDEDDLRSLPGGPGELTSQNIFRSHWQEKAAELRPRQLTTVDAPAKKCTVWEQVMGDAGWGGIVAERAEKGDPISIMFSAEHSGAMLRTLIGEALALLPPSVRWKITFSTYFMQSHEATGDKIQVKCFLADSEASKLIRQSPHTLVMDLRQQPSAVPTGKYVEAARGLMEPSKKKPSTQVSADATPIPSLSRVQRALQEVASKKVRVEETAAAMDFLLTEHSEEINPIPVNVPLANDTKWQTCLKWLQPIVIVLLTVGLIVLASRNANLHTGEALNEKILQITKITNENGEYKKSIDELKKQNGTLTENQTEYLAQIEVKDKEIEKLGEENKGLANDLQSTTNVFEKTDKVLREERNTNEERIKNLEKEIEDLKKEIAIKTVAGNMPQPPNTEQLDLENNLTKLPATWSIALPPVANPAVLPDSKFLADSQKQITLEYSPSQGLKEVHVEAGKHAITFSFDALSLPSVRQGTQLAKIELKEQGLQFEWLWNDPPNERLKNILRQIAQSELRILIDNNGKSESKVINLVCP